MTGLGNAANLMNVVPMLSDDALVSTLLNGKGAMPSWEELKDQELADIRAFLREATGTQNSPR